MRPRAIASRRSRLAVGGNRYSPVSTVYQPALTFSISETVPSGDSQRSSWLLSPAVAEPAALPVAVVLADWLPICMSVVTQPVSSSAPTATAASGNLLNVMKGLPLLEICDLKISGEDTRKRLQETITQKSEPRPAG